MRMKVAIFLGVLAVSTYVTAYRCKEDGQKCVNDMIDAVQGSREETEEVYCGKVRKSVDCITAVADRCMSKRERQEAQKHIDRMIESTNKICSEQNDDKNEVDDSELPDEKQKMIDCVNDEAKFSSNIKECYGQLRRKIRSRSWKSTENSRDNTCIKFLFITQCVAKKVGEDCGEETEEPFLNGMISGLKELESDIALSPKCVEAIREADEYLSNLNEHKRRFVRDVSFAKLIL